MTAVELRLPPGYTDAVLLRLRASSRPALSSDLASRCDAAAGTLCAPAEKHVARAWPVHLRQDLTRARVLYGPPADDPDLHAYSALARSVLGSEAWIDRGWWCVRWAEPIEAASQPPWDWLGAEPPPVGPRSLRGRLGELEVELHHAEFNRKRSARGDPPLNSLLLWGAAPFVYDGPRPTVILADDPALIAAGQRFGATTHPASAASTLLIEHRAGGHLYIDGRDLTRPQIGEVLSVLHDRLRRLRLRSLITHQDGDSALISGWQRLALWRRR